MLQNNSGTNRKPNKYYSLIDLGLTLDKFNTVDACYKAVKLVESLAKKKILRKPTARAHIQKLNTKAYKLLSNESENR